VSLIRVARITRTQGLHGAVRVERILEDDRVLESGRQLRMSVSGQERTVEVEFFRKQHGRFVMKFCGIDSIDDAEKIIGADLQIGEDELPAPGEGAFYTFRLRGCRVYAIEDGKEDLIGEVTDILDGGTPILRVGSGKDETLIPFAETMIRKIDLDGKRIEVKLPEGLRELNK